MTPKQKAMYWREWSAVRAHCKAHALPEPDRHELHERALGDHKSSKSLTNSDLDQVLAVFRSISQGDNIDAQVRQLEQPATRKRVKLRELLQCLAVYPLAQPMGEAGARAYAREIVRDKVNRGSRRAVTEIEDLSAEPRYVTSHRTGELLELPSQLDQLMFTLSSRLNGKTGLRAQAGDSGHEMLQRAGLPCFCGACKAQPMVRQPAQEPAHAGAETNEPF